MIILLSIIFAVLFINGGLLIYDEALSLPDYRTGAALERATNVRKESFKAKIIKNVIKPLSGLLKPYISFDKKRKALLTAELNRAGFSQSAEEYYAEAAAWSILMLPVVPLLIYLGFELLSFFTIICVPVIFFTLTRRHLGVLKKKTEQIELVLPTFIRSILYKISDEADGVVKANLPGIFEAYLKICPEVFHYDISVLLFDMNTKDIEGALISFNQRVGIPEVSYLVNALIGLHRGEYQRDVFASLAKEMSVKNRGNIQKQLDKRPRKVIAACIPLFILAFLSIGYVLITSLLMGFSSLF